MATSYFNDYSSKRAVALTRGDYVTSHETYCASIGKLCIITFRFDISSALSFGNKIFKNMNVPGFAANGIVTRVKMNNSDKMYNVFLDSYGSSGDGYCLLAGESIPYTGSFRGSVAYVII